MWQGWRTSRGRSRSLNGCFDVAGLDSGFGVDYDFGAHFGYDVDSGLGTHSRVSVQPSNVAVVDSFLAGL